MSIISHIQHWIKGQSHNHLTDMFLKKTTHLCIPSTATPKLWGHHEGRQLTSVHHHLFLTYFWHIENMNAESWVLLWAIGVGPRNWKMKWTLPQSLQKELGQYTTFILAQGTSASLLMYNQINLGISHLEWFDTAVIGN